MTQKNSRPRRRTALPRKDPLEANGRNARGQEPKTQAQVFSKEKGLQEKFSGILKKKKRPSKIFFRRSPKTKVFKNFFLTNCKI